MAKGKKTGGKDFVPGDPRAGRPPMDADLKKANALTSAALKKTLNSLLFMDNIALEAHLAKPETNQLERMIGKIIEMANKYGDTQRLDFVLNRLIGKVSEKVEVTIPEPFIVNRLDGSQVVMGAQLKKTDEDVA